MKQIHQFEKRGEILLHSGLCMESLITEIKRTIYRVFFSISLIKVCEKKSVLCPLGPDYPQICCVLLYCASSISHSMNPTQQF